MSDRGVISSSSRSGQLVWVDYARPPTSEGHISFVRTPIRVFLDSMESPLSQEYIHITEEDRRCLIEVIDRARPGQVSSSVQDLIAYDLLLRKVITIRSNSYLGVLGLYGKPIESRIHSYA